MKAVCHLDPAKLASEWLVAGSPGGGGGGGELRHAGLMSSSPMRQWLLNGEQV